MAASAQTEGWHQPTYLLGKRAHIPIFLRFLPLTVEQTTDTSLYSVAEFHAHRTKCLLSHSFLPFSFHLFSLSRYCFHFSVCQGFPLHVFDFSIPSPPPPGELALAAYRYLPVEKHYNYCRCWNVDPIPSQPQITTTPWLRHIPAGSQCSRQLFLSIEKSRCRLRHGGVCEAPAMNSQSLPLIHADV